MKNRSAFQFVLIMGIANFFADFTYEGARAIIGPFLGSLGASAAIVNFVAVLASKSDREHGGVPGTSSHDSGFRVRGIHQKLGYGCAYRLAGGLLVETETGRGIGFEAIESACRRAAQ